MTPAPLAALFARSALAVLFVTDDFPEVRTP